MRQAFDATEFGVSPNMQNQRKRPSSAKPPQQQQNSNRNPAQQFQDNFRLEQQSEQLYNPYTEEVQQYNHQPQSYNANFNKRNGSKERLMRPPTANNRKQNNNFMNTSNNNDITNDYGSQKTLPRNIQIDKEKLYSDNLKLKNQVNDLQKENMKMRTKISAIERGYQKLEKRLEQENQYQGSNTRIKKGGGSQDNTFLVSSLKKQVKEQKEQLQEKQEQLAQLRKDIKSSKLQEMEVEKNAYESEAQRLKQMLEQSLKQKMHVMIQESDFQSMEEKCYQQDNYINQLKSDNSELATLLKTLEDQSIQLQGDLEQSQYKYKQDIQQLRRQLKDKDRELQIYKQQTHLNRPLSGKKQRPDQLNRSRNYTQQNQPNAQELQQQLQEKDDRIMQLQRQLDGIAYHNKQQNSQNNNNNNHTYSQDTFRDVKNSKNNNQNNTDNKDNSRILNDSKLTNGNQIQSKQSIRNVELIDTIPLQKVKPIGIELKFKLQAQAADWEVIRKDDRFKNPDNTTTTKKIQSILQEDPFSLSEQDAYKLGRYLIEGDEQKQVEKSENLQEKNKIILDRLKNVLPKYNVWSEQQAKKLFKSIGDLLSSYQSLLETTFEMYANRHQKQYISHDQLIYSLQQCDIQLTDDQLDFMISSVILDSPEGLQTLEYSRFFDIFKRPEKSINSSYEDDEDQDQDEYRDSYENDFENFDSGKNFKRIQANKDSSEENKIINQYAGNSSNFDNYNIDDQIQQQEKELMGEWNEEDQSEHFDSYSHSRLSNKGKQQTQKKKVSDDINQYYDDNFDEEIIEEPENIHSSSNKNNQEVLDEAIITEDY